MYHHFIIILVITMTSQVSSLPSTETMKPNSPTSSIPQPKYEDYLDRITSLEFIDGDTLDVFWTPSKENEPMLKLVSSTSFDEYPDDFKPCDEVEMSVPLTSNETIEYASCQVFKYTMVHLKIALLPTICYGNNLTNLINCPLVENVKPKRFRSVITMEMRRFFRVPATLEWHKDSYKYWFTFILSDELPWRTEYEVANIEYRLQEFLDGEGRDETDDENWTDIYVGSKNRYVLKTIHTVGVRKYRVFFRDNDGIGEPIVWSLESNSVEIDFQHETTPTIPSTTVPTTSPDPTRASMIAKRRLTYAIVSTVVVVFVVVLLVFSYYFCYKHLGLCKRVNGGIPRPKLLIPISHQHDPTAPQNHTKSPQDMEEAVDEATPLGREHLISSEHCMENEMDKLANENEGGNDELFRQSYIQDINNILNQIDPKNSLSKI